MNSFKNRVVRAGLTLGLAGLIAAGSVIPALAADSTDVTVSSGSLAFTTAPTVGNFTLVTLSGVDQTTTATLDDFEVNDSRGSGAGWNVTMQATQFAEWNGTAYVTGGKTLPTGSLTMPVPRVTADGTTSTAPSISISTATAIDAASAVKIASAAVDTGMGKYDFDDGTVAIGIPLTLTLKPATTYAKTYRSDVTITVATGP